MQDAYNRIWWWYRFEWDGSLYWTRRKGPPLPWRTDPLVASILLIQEVDYDNIMLLTVPVAAPDALLDALRVPREVVVDDQRAELKIDPLCGGFGGDHDYRLWNLIGSSHSQLADSSWMAGNLEPGSGAERSIRPPSRREFPSPGLRA